MSDELTIDEAVAVLSNLEREERKKWQAVTRLKGLLGMAQSLRDAESRLQNQAKEYTEKEAKAKADYEQRYAQITESRAHLESDYARLTEDLSAKQRDLEEKTNEAMTAATKQYRSKVSEMDGHLRQLEQDRHAKLTAWEKEQNEKQAFHAQLAHERAVEIASLDAQLSTLKGELAKIEALFTRRG
jgi:chromosome segregation ATPase